MNILLIGPQGSGKGTQAKFLSQKYGLFILEMGELLRDAAKSNPEINRLINVEGKLVPDELAFNIITKKIEESAPGKDGLLLDGFPRTVSQYEMLETWLTASGKKLDLAILIDVPDPVSIERLSARRECMKCGRIWNLVTSPRPPREDICQCGGSLFQRQDDIPEAIQKRLQIYHETTGKLVELFGKKGILLRVDGTKPIGGVTEEIYSGLDSWKASSVAK